jgi:hypothetical protein
MTDIHNTGTVSLSVYCLHKALTLLRIYIRNEGLSCFEIISYPVWLILVGTLLEKRLTLNNTGRILTSCCIYQTTVNTDINLLGIQFQVLVINLTIAVKMST